MKSLSVTARQSDVKERYDLPWRTAKSHVSLQSFDTTAIVSPWV